MKYGLYIIEKILTGDNGEYFFRYLLKINPKGIGFYFVI